MSKPAYKEGDLVKFYSLKTSKLEEGTIIKIVKSMYPTYRVKFEVLDKPIVEIILEEEILVKV